MSDSEPSEYKSWTFMLNAAKESISTRHGFKLTAHAQQRRKEMGVTEDRINETLNDPHMVYPGAPHHGPNRTSYQRDDLVVIVDNSTMKVLTILWHAKEGR